MLKLGAEALTAFLCVLAVIANLFVIKQITLFGLTATAADVYIVGSVLTLNLLQEYYGKQLARKAVWISFFLMIFYTIVSQIHITYTPSISDFSHNYYYQLLSYMPRITSASIIVYLIVQHFDTYFYAILKSFFNSRYLLLRNIISISISQLLDTILFSFLGLYGIISHIGEVMIIAFTIKIISMVLLTPLVLFIKYYLEQKI